MRTMFLGVVAAIVILGAAPAAEAVTKIKCDVLTIEASVGTAGIDPSLGTYANIFKQAPFNAFNTFKLVTRTTHRLDLGVPAGLSMPTPLQGNVRFDGDQGGKFHLTLTIIRPNLEPILLQGKATPGTPFFAAGLKTNTGGRWIFGVSCNKLDGVVQH